jgi:hypothetical protein
VGTAHQESQENNVDQHFEALLEASSLGTPAARRIRSSTPADVVEDVRRRMKRNSQEDPQQRPLARPQPVSAAADGKTGAAAAQLDRLQHARGGAHVASGAPSYPGVLVASSGQPLADERELLVERTLLDEPMQVTVVGSFKSGKSTLLNALLADQDLPAGPAKSSDITIYDRDGVREHADILPGKALDLLADRMPQLKADAPRARRPLIAVFYVVVYDPSAAAATRALRFMLAEPESPLTGFSGVPDARVTLWDHGDRGVFHMTQILTNWLPAGGPETGFPAVRLHQVIYDKTLQALLHQLRTRPPMAAAELVRLIELNLPAKNAAGSGTPGMPDLADIWYIRDPLQDLQLPQPMAGDPRIRMLWHWAARPDAGDMTHFHREPSQAADAYMYTGPLAAFMENSGWQARRPDGLRWLQRRAAEISAALRGKPRAPDASRHPFNRISLPPWITRRQ